MTRSKRPCCPVSSRRGGFPTGDGLDLIAAARKLHPDLLSLVIVDREDRSALRRAALLGALVHDEPIDPMVIESAAACALRSHAQSFDVRLAFVLDRWGRAGALTATEREVVRRACLGLNKDEIVAGMGFAESTYRKHVEHVLAKTGDVMFSEVTNRVLLETAGGTPLTRAAHARAGRRRS